MKKISYTFSRQTTDYYFDATWRELDELTTGYSVIFITDENIQRLHSDKLKDRKTIIIPAGEKHKQQNTADQIILELISFEADKSTFIIAVGGGVVTDLAGYVASVYLRGVKFAFVPTTLLAMVDASNGGKNGVDVGQYKNLVGTISQPQFIFYDLSFLDTLPLKEFSNGCAEMIKHGCIRDASIFKLLSAYTPEKLLKDRQVLGGLIEKNVVLKSQIVQEDEFEKGDRALLNFGHTVGHAIENVFNLMHGEAISIGMVVASKLSEKFFDFPSTETEKLIGTLKNYHLPVEIPDNIKDAIHALKMDKKRTNGEIRFVLLKEIGRAKTYQISIIELENIIKTIR
ncbi:MAG TPA: 3-dehydroquinate synthase [Flavitalea sp.]|nr:3-dehydroquinate synthase [Flavitalea sp.]